MTFAVVQYSSLFRDLVRCARRLPVESIALQHEAVSGRDPFYADITKAFYQDATARHRRLPLIGRLTHGVALCPLDTRAYLACIEASGRRNVRKAERLGYQFAPIAYNAYLPDIAVIRRSTDTRQGKLPEGFLASEVVPCRNPDPLTGTHAYPYFGVLKDGRLYAYAGVLVAGELAMIEHIYGHAAHHADGVVPLLLAGMAEYIRLHFPAVRYYGYGSYFGASQTLRRFKRKFCFEPHRVKWTL
jgi:hypothetical protein